MATQWYVESGGKEHGPLSPAELRAMAEQGRITGSTRVRQGTDGAWVAAHRVKGLFDAPESDRPTMLLPGSTPAAAVPPMPQPSPPVASRQPPAPVIASAPASRASADPVPAAVQPVFTPPQFVPEDKEARHTLWFCLWGFTSIAAMVMFALLIYAITNAVSKRPMEGVGADSTQVGTSAGAMAPSGRSLPNSSPAKGHAAP